MFRKNLTHHLASATMPTERPLRRWLRRGSRAAAVTGALVLAAPGAFAITASGMAFTASGAAGGSVMDQVGGSVNGITSLIMGPGLYVVMAIGALLALYGFGRGQKETLFSGIGLFVLAAIIKGVFVIL